MWQSVKIAPQERTLQQQESHPVTVATTAVQESTALNQALPSPSSVAPRVQKDGFKILQGALLVSKLNQATLSRKEEVHRFKYQLDPKFVTMALVAPIKRLLLKHAQQDSTARIHLQISARNVLLDSQARNRQQNVKCGTSLFLLLFVR